MNKMLAYPAYFEYEDDYITVTFPDFNGIVTFGSTFEKAYENAVNCLKYTLTSLSLSEFPIPTDEECEGVYNVLINVDMKEE